MEEFNETRGTHLVDVAGVHIEPMGIYAGRVESLEDLPDGAVIGVPKDVYKRQIPRRDPTVVSIRPHIA